MEMHQAPRCLAWPVVSRWHGMLYVTGAPRDSEMRWVVRISSTWMVGVETCSGLWCGVAFNGQCVLGTVLVHHDRKAGHRRLSFMLVCAELASISVYQLSVTV